VRNAAGATPAADFCFLFLKPLLSFVFIRLAGGVQPAALPPEVRQRTLKQQQAIEEQAHMTEVAPPTIRR
jgi:hypothetical protein